MVTPTPAAAPKVAPAPPAPTVVTPVVGMPVLYYPGTKAITNLTPGIGYAATIASVTSTGTLNLAVWDGVATHHAMLNVPFVQPGATAPSTGGYAVAPPTQNLVVSTTT
jgi:hypothetical protein